MRITLCINRDQPTNRMLIESNYRNNCFSKRTKQLLPDLMVRQGCLVLFKPKKKKGLLSCIGKVWWDTITDNSGFDVSGLKQDAVRIYITNKGGITLTHFKIAVGISTPGGSGCTYYSHYRKPLRTG